MASRIQWEQEGILLERTGAETLEDYQEIVAHLAEDPRYDTIRYVLCDLRKASCENEADVQEINEVLAVFMSHLFSERNFAVADVVSDLASATSSKHYATLAAHPFAIFTDMTEARNWLSDYLKKTLSASAPSQPQIEPVASEHPSIQVNWEENGILASINGELTLDDFRLAIKQVWQDHRYDHMRYLILDSTNQAPGCALRKWEIEVLALIAKGVYRGKQFIVAEVVNPAHKDNVAAAKCYGKLAVHPHAVFTNMADARNWVQAYLEKS